MRINTWNQERITRDKEQVCLINLKTEFENNLEVLEAEINRNHQNRIANDLLSDLENKALNS